MRQGKPAIFNEYRVQTIEMDIKRFSHLINVVQDVLWKDLVQEIDNIESCPVNIQARLVRALKAEIDAIKVEMEHVMPASSANQSIWLMPPAALLAPPPPPSPLLGALAHSLAARRTSSSGFSVQRSAPSSPTTSAARGQAYSPPPSLLLE